MTATALDLVIVGNGAAAAEAAQAARAAGHRGEIDLFADNHYPPYNPMLGPYYVAGAIPAERCFPFGGAGFYERNRIRTHLGEGVVELAPWEKRLATTDGSEYTYRACLVASGAHTSFPPIAGLDAPGVFGLRSFDDALAVKEAVARAMARAAGDARAPWPAGDSLAPRPAGDSLAPRAVVLGASFAGLKVADALRDAGLEVCIVEKEPGVLPLAVLPDCGRLIEQHVRQQGHTLMLGATVDRVEETEGRLIARLGRRSAGAGAARADARAPAVEPVAAAHDRGESVESLEADLLVVCAGSRPNLAFLAGGEVETDAGIVVDEHMKTNVPGLFAAGDVAQALDPLSGRHEVVALWASARRQGRTAGRNMAGLHAEDPGCTSCNIQKVGDLLFASGGSSREYDSLDARVGGGGLSTLAYREGRLTGFNLVGGAAAAGPLACALVRGTDVNVADGASATQWARRIAWMRSSAS